MQDAIPRLCMLLNTKPMLLLVHCLNLNPFSNLPANAMTHRNLLFCIVGNVVSIVQYLVNTTILANDDRHCIPPRLWVR